MSDQTVDTYTFRQLESRAAAGRSASDVVTNALAEAEAIRAQAQADGEAAGYASGIARAREEASAALLALREAAAAVSSLQEELTETLTAQAGELALLTAEQLIAGAIAAQPERIADVVRAALRRLTDRHHVTVLVNPEDLAAVSGCLGILQAELGGIEHLDVQADRRIARAGAVAQTVYGEIDATITTQLQSARELLRSALRGDEHTEDQPGSNTSALAAADGL